MIIVKYANRKLYNKETSKYVNFNELLALPLGSFQVVEHGTNTDVTVDTLFSYLGNTSDPLGVVQDTKVKVMTHLIKELSK